MKAQVRMEQGIGMQARAKNNHKWMQKITTSNIRSPRAANLRSPRAISPGMRRVKVARGEIGRSDHQKARKSNRKDPGNEKQFVQTKSRFDMGTAIQVETDDFQLETIPDVDWPEPSKPGDASERKKIMPLMFSEFKQPTPSIHSKKSSKAQRTQNNVNMV